MMGPELQNESEFEERLTPPLIIFAGGNNSRLGNMLLPYIELRLVCDLAGRTLVFPFAEEVIGRFFDFHSQRDSSETIEQSRTLYGRLTRSAEERIEFAENVQAYQYSPDNIHKVTFDLIGLDVLIHRGKIDWRKFIEESGLDGQRPILLKDPSPFNVSGKSLSDLLEVGQTLFKPKKDVFKEGNLLKGNQCPPNALDIVFHHRQGDFLRWNNGAFWYDGALMRGLLDRIYASSDLLGRKPHVTIVSDEPLPEELAARSDISFQSGSLEEDFTRIAAADIVFSNSSTFSRLAAGVGDVLLGNGTKYFSLERNNQAGELLDRALKEVSL